MNVFSAVIFGVGGIITALIYAIVRDATRHKQEENQEDAVFAVTYLLVSIGMFVACFFTVLELIMPVVATP